MNLRPLVIVALVPIFLASSRLSGQATPAATHVETAQELLARLTSAQQQQFSEATSAHRAKRYADALALWKQLLKELPGDTTLTKFTAQSALYTGDNDFALNVLKPIAQANPDDWQAGGCNANSRICPDGR